MFSFDNIVIKVNSLFFICLGIFVPDTIRKTLINTYIVCIQLNFHRVKKYKLSNEQLVVIQTVRDTPIILLLYLHINIYVCSTQIKKIHNGE